MIYDGKPIHSKLHMMYCQISSPINLKFNTNCDKNSKVFKERFSAKTLFQNSVKNSRDFIDATFDKFVLRFYCDALSESCLEPYILL